ncbi:MAG: hypothetical protein Kow00123_23120 [Anaerolineales bacterium]
MRLEVAVHGCHYLDIFLIGVQDGFRTLGSRLPSTRPRVEDEEPSCTVGVFQPNAEIIRVPEYQNLRVPFPHEFQKGLHSLAGLADANFAALIHIAMPKANSYGSVCLSHTLIVCHSQSECIWPYRKANGPWSVIDGLWLPYLGPTLCRECQHQYHYRRQAHYPGIAGVSEFGEQGLHGNFPLRFLVFALTVSQGHSLGTHMGSLLGRMPDF